MKKCILVPYDFSNESNFAMEHAYKFAKNSELPIKLIHVVNSEKDIFDWKIEVEKVAKKFSQENNIKVTAEVRAGTLLETIYSYGLEVNTYLAIIGTHGIKTIDKAMKLVKRFLKIPFILVQRPIAFGEFDKICVPITDNKKIRAKFQWVRHLEYLFKSQVYLCPVEYKDTERKKELTRNLQFAIDLFEEYAIDFEVKYIHEHNVTDELYDYMYQLEPDIVLFMTDQYKKIVHDIQKPQNIELAKKIPVMCVNHRIDITKIVGFN